MKEIPHTFFFGLDGLTRVGRMVFYIRGNGTISRIHATHQGHKSVETDSVRWKGAVSLKLHGKDRLFFLGQRVYWNHHAMHWLKPLNCGFEFSRRQVARHCAFALAWLLVGLPIYNVVPTFVVNILAESGEEEAEVPGSEESPFHNKSASSGSRGRASQGAQITNLGHKSSSTVRSSPSYPKCSRLRDRAEFLGTGVGLRC